MIVFISALFRSADVDAASNDRIYVEKVGFTGNSAYSGGRLQRVMLTRPSGFLSRKQFRPEIFSDDLEAIEQFYRQNGYLEAAVTGHTVEVDSVRARADILITIDEGERTFVEGVGVLGNEVYPDSLLMRKVLIGANDPFRRKQVNDSTVALLTLYADSGYLDAEIRPDVRIDSLTHRALIDFIITEKEQYTIGDIRITGLDKTNGNVVEREFLFAPGEVVNYSRLLESQRNIYLTGLFQSVFIRPVANERGDPAKKDIHVDVSENMSGEFNVAGGYGSLDRVRGKMEVYNNNVRGTALKLGLVGKISFIQRGVESSFTNPWTFGTRWRTDFNLVADQKEEPGYDYDRLGGKLTIGRTFRKNTITLSSRNERVKLKNVETTEVPDDLKTNTRSLKLSFIRDTRDNLFNATRGLYFETSSEFGGFFTARTSTFVRLLGTVRYFRQIRTGTVIATSLDTGWIDAEGGLHNIPLYERFYAGGPNSLRGYKYNRVGPLDSNGKPSGGKFKLIWNIVEVRRTLYRMIGGVVFADVGNVWQEPGDFGIRDLRPDAGVGLRVNTPIGLARLDYGYNLDRRENEPPWRMYFSMGQAF